MKKIEHHYRGYRIVRYRRDRYQVRHEGDEKATDFTICESLQASKDHIDQMLEDDKPKVWLTGCAGCGKEPGDEGLTLVDDGDGTYGLCDECMEKRIDEQADGYDAWNDKEQAKHEEMLDSMEDGQ